MKDLYSRLSDFVESLAPYPPKEKPSIQVGEIFNALLAATKEQYPDDPIVAAIEPTRRLGVSDQTNTDAGSLIAAGEQLRAAAADDRGPMIAFA